MPLPLRRTVEHRSVEVELIVRFEETVQVVVLGLDDVVALDSRHYALQAFVVLLLLQAGVDLIDEIVDGHDLSTKQKTSDLIAVVFDRNVKKLTTIKVKLSRSTSSSVFL